MDLLPTPLPGLKLLSPMRHQDCRGWFSETFHARILAEAGIDVAFVQDNQSFSVQAGTIRGLHFQRPPSAQAKLVRCLVGAVLDVALDIRRGSPTYGQHFSVELSAENGLQLFLPAGFAHGFCSLRPNTEVLYKVDRYYSPADDAGILWNDPDLGIVWPVSEEDAMLSPRDCVHPRLRDLAAPFVYGESSADGQS